MSKPEAFAFSHSLTPCVPPLNVYTGLQEEERCLSPRGELYLKLDCEGKD